MKELSKKELKADLWTGQSSSENTLSHEWNSLAYNPAQQSDLTVSGPNPTDNEALWDIVVERFFGNHDKWSDVIKALKEANPNITPEQISSIKDRIKQSLDNQMDLMPRQAKKKHLNLNDALKILVANGHYILNIDSETGHVTFDDGSILSFDDVANKAMEIEKKGSAESEEQERDKDAGTGFFDTPNGFMLGKGKSWGEFPSVEWMPSGQESKDAEPYNNIAASLSKKELIKTSEKNLPILSNKIVTDLIPMFVDKTKPSDHKCGSCKFRIEKEGKTICAIMEGNIDLKKGTCNYWSEGDSSKEQNPSQMDRKTAGYIEAGIVNCGSCKHFKDGVCSLWNGLVKAEQCCMAWEGQTIKEGSLDKIANPDSRYWIAPDGKEFPVSSNHLMWVKNNKSILSKYKNLKSNQPLTNIYDDMLNSGWIRVSNEPAGSGFQIETLNLKAIPSYVDDFISKHFKQGDTILIGSNSTGGVQITDPFPNIQKAVNKALQQKRMGSLNKQATPAQDILNLVKETGGATYNLSNGSLAGTENYAVATHPDRSAILSVEPSEKELDEYIKNNSDLLDNATSVGVWEDKSTGKWYLDIVSTIPNVEQAKELAKKYNQIAIFDLKNFQEIPTGGTGEKISTLKKADQDHCEECGTPLGVYEDTICNTCTRNSKRDSWVMDRICEIQNKEHRFVNWMEKEQLEKEWEHLNSNLKTADQSSVPQDIQDQIAAKYDCPALNIFLENFVDATKRGHDKQRSFDYAIELAKNVDKNISEKEAVEVVNTYSKALI